MTPKYTFKFNNKDKSFEIESANEKLIVKNFNVNKVSTKKANEMPSNVESKNSIQTLSYTLFIEDKISNKTRRIIIKDSDTFCYLYKFTSEIIKSKNLSKIEFAPTSENLFDKKIYSSNDSATMKKIYDYVSIKVPTKTFGEYSIKMSLQMYNYEYIPKIEHKIFINDITKEDIFEIHKELTRLFGFLMNKTNAYLKKQIALQKLNKKIYIKDGERTLEYTYFKSNNNQCLEKAKIKEYVKRKDILSILKFIDDEKCLHNRKNIKVLAIHENSITFQKDDQNPFEVHYKNIIMLRKKLINN